jgi:hypothetical protein
MCLLGENRPGAAVRCTRSVTASSQRALCEVPATFERNTAFVAWSGRRRRAPREIIPAPVSISESANRAKRGAAGSSPAGARDFAGTPGTSPGRPGLRRDARDFAGTPGTSPGRPGLRRDARATSPAAGATSPGRPELRRPTRAFVLVAACARRSPSGSGDGREVRVSRSPPVPAGEAGHPRHRRECR